jgi:hypothetical protein
VRGARLQRARGGTDARHHARVDQQRIAARTGHARAAPAGAQPARSQREILDELGDEAARLVDAYVEALQAGDVARLTELLAEDVKFSMPPFEAWWQGRDVVVAFATADSASRRCVPLRVNGQLAFAAYRLDGGRYLAELLEVLVVDGRGRVTDITVFVEPSGPCEGEPAEPGSDMASLFQRLGLPALLEDG